jgi:hypothetical protein
MGFIDKLRMNSIYGGGSMISKPLRRIEYEDEPDPLIEAQKRLQLKLIGEQLKAAEMKNTNALVNRFKPQQMDVVYQPSASERVSSIGQRMMTPYQSESLKLRDRSLDISEGRANDNEAIQRERLKITQAGQALREWKAQNPTQQIKAVRGGNYMIFNPVTGETQDTGIPSGTLDRETELELIQDNRLETLDRGHANRLVEIGKRGEITSGHIAQRGGEARLTRQTPNATTIREELPTQLKTRLYNNAMRFLNQYPEWAGKHIKLGSNNEFTLEQGSLSNEEYKQMYDAIYQDAPTPKPNVTSTLNKPATGAQLPNEVAMITPDGRTVMVPVEKVKEAEKNGAKRKQ